MKKIVLIIIVFVAVQFIFSSCERENSSDVNQDRIYVMYEMVYDESTDITYARTSFFFGSIVGTKLELADPSKIYCNDELLSFQSALAYYEKQYTGYIDTGNFKFTDTEGNVFTNLVNITKIELTQNIDTIIRGELFKLDFSGEPLASGEGLYAYIDGPTENDNIELYQNTSGATSITISANQTSRLSAGTNKLCLRRKIEIIPQEANSAGASCAGVYQTKEINIEVAEMR